eukprot:3114239-Lingulodinium_polyedra.AAC.1
MPAPREVPIGCGCVILDLPRGRCPVGAFGGPHGRFAFGRLGKEGLAIAHWPSNAGTPDVVPFRVLATVL